MASKYTFIFDSDVIDSRINQKSKVSKEFVENVYQNSYRNLSKFIFSNYEFHF